MQYPRCHCLHSFTLARLAIGVGFPVAAAAQAEWRTAELFTPRAGMAACYDTAHTRVVMFGGDDGAALHGDTWLWDHGVRSRLEVSGPAARTNHRLAYDPSRQLVWMFGGKGAAGELGDTWSFDGINWSLATPSGPQPRQGHALEMVNSGVGSSTLLLFGGRRNQVLLGDTWTWDGTAWTQHSPSASPSPREGAAVARLANGAATLFGGRDATGLRADTWSWATNTWQAVATTGPVPARADAALACTDGITLLLAGGADDLGPRSDTWLLVGTTWTPQPLATGLVARSAAAVTFDAGNQQVVLVGGAGNPGQWFGDLVTYGPSPTWTTQVPSEVPPARQYHAMAYDPWRARTVLFGGGTQSGTELGDTWEWDGSRWLLRSSNGPSPRQYSAIAFDDHRTHCLLFGGRDTGGARSDTWEWNGTAWNQLLPAQSPPARQAHAMTAAPGGGLLLFGGSDSGFVAFGDTWRWTGSQWVQVAGPAPAPREFPAMAYDADRGEVVLFGGRCGGGIVNDTWTFDGTGWQLRSPGHQPPARANAAMTFAAERDRIVLTGGLAANFTCLADTWQWDGDDWQPTTTASVPTARCAATMVYHATSETSLLIGGTNLSASLPDTQQFRSAITAAYEPFGTNCPGPWGAPFLHAAGFQRPWLGDSFEVQIDNLPPNPGFLFLIFSFTDTTWQGSLLPVALDNVGMPGCTAWVSPDLPRLLPHSGNTQTFPFVLPSVPDFAGITYFNQALVLDATVPNALHAVMTNAGRAVVGWR